MSISISSSSSPSFDSGLERALGADWELLEVVLDGGGCLLNGRFVFLFGRCLFGFGGPPCFCVRAPWSLPSAFFLLEDMMLATVVSQKALWLAQQAQQMPGFENEIKLGHHSDVFPLHIKISPFEKCQENTSKSA